MLLLLAATPTVRGAGRGLRAQGGRRLHPPPANQPPRPVHTDETEKKEKAKKLASGMIRPLKVVPSALSPESDAGAFGGRAEYSGRGDISRLCF